jgi:hypothetical protein
MTAPASIPAFIQPGQRVVVDVLAEPGAEDNSWNRQKCGVWDIVSSKLDKRAGDSAERLYVTMESVGRKNKAYITLPYSPLVIRPENAPPVALQDVFQAAMHPRATVTAPATARFTRRPARNL